MTYRNHEADLALYVEGDLPDRRVPAVERHLASCGACRAFLGELQSSQAALADLRSEPVNEASLAAVRQRVIGARSSNLTHAAPWRWALAASLALAAAGGASAWLLANRLSVRTASPESASTEVVVPAPTTRTASEPAATISLSPIPRTGPDPGGNHRESTLPTLTEVSRHMVRSPEIALSADDADQLARAVQVIAAVQRVPDTPTETPPVSASEATTFVRLATADPTVVIYWQLEPIGGI